MRVLDAFRLVWSSIAQNISKTLLTALGIAIGITAVTLLTAIGGGIEQYVLNQFSQFGTRIIAVHPGKNVTHGVGGLLSTVRPLSVADADSLRGISGVEQVVGVVQGTGTIEAGHRQRNGDILGVGAQMPEAWRFRLALGRFLPDDERGRSRPYAVLGHTMRQELFGEQNPLGQFVRVGGMRFRVIGVIEQKGQILGFDMDDIVYIPVDQALQMFNREGLMEIDVTFSGTSSSAAVAQAITRQLVERHGDEDFTLTTQDEMLATLDKVLSVLTAGVAALGAISLLVGAVGIATILTTTVRERTGEIGLLRALGSSQGQVLGLFLGEAVLIALLGGLMGLLLLGIILSGFSLMLPTLPFLLDARYLVIALIASATIGLIAGVIPARSAARLNPVDALRAE